MASGDWKGEKGVGGELETEPLTESKNFILTCTGPGGKISTFANINFESSPRPTISFTANPTNIVFGKPIALAWSSTNAITCKADGSWSGEKSTSGLFLTEAITGARTFTLKCSGPGGYASHSIRIGAPSASESKAPVTGKLVPINSVSSKTTKTPVDTSVSLDLSYSTKIVKGNNNVILKWNSKNVKSCAATGGWSGSRPIKGTENVGKVVIGKTYTLNCTGKDVISRSVTL